MKHFKRVLAALLAAAGLFTSAFALDLSDAQTLTEAYYAGSIPDSAYAAETVRDFIAALGDPYSQYFTAEEYSAFLASMADETLVGIGVTATAAEGGVRVEEVLAGSGAEEAGLLSGDILFSVNGTDVTALPLEEAIALIRGEEGSWVRIGYLREGQRKSATVQRKTVTIAATDGEIWPGGVGYIRCTTFGNETYGHFSDLIAAMDGQVCGYLIDLRGNTGGLTDAAAQSAGLFAGSSSVIRLRYSDGSYEYYPHLENAATEQPVIVLVDEYTASASEAFAGILRDTGRGLIVGTRTYGKGVAQGILDAASFPQLFDGDALKLTMARFYSPLGNTSDGVGVIPDLLVDGDYAALAGWILLAEGSEESDALLTLDTLQSRFTLDLELLETEDLHLAFAMVLDGVEESAVMRLNGVDITREELAETFGLVLKNPGLSDGEMAENPAILDTFLRHGLISGGSDGAFHPAAPLTRAQLCQLLRNLFPAQSAGESPFSDVTEEDWYCDAVSFAAARGFVTGVGDGRFDPDGTVTTEQFIAILGRVAQYLNCDLLDDGEWWEAQDLTLFADYPAWCQTELWVLEKSQNDSEREISLLWDDLDTLSPQAPISRETAVYGLYRVLSYLRYLA